MSPSNAWTPRGVTLTGKEMRSRAGRANPFQQLPGHTATAAHCLSSSTEVRTTAVATGWGTQEAWYLNTSPTTFTNDMHSWRFGGISLRTLRWTLSGQWTDFFLWRFHSPTCSYLRVSVHLPETSLKCTLMLIYLWHVPQCGVHLFSCFVELSCSCTSFPCNWMFPYFLYGIIFYLHYSLHYTQEPTGDFQWQKKDYTGKIVGVKIRSN